MGEQPQEEILVAPEFTMLEFGDGYMALLQGGVKGEDNDGNKIVTFMIKPSEILRKRYNIKDSMLNKNWAMEFKVSEKDLIHMNPYDDANKKILYIKNFKHEETEISNIGWSLRKRLGEMEKRVVVLEGELIWMSEQLQLAKTNPTEFLTQATEIYEKMLPRMAEIFKGKKDKEES